MKILFISRDDIISKEVYDAIREEFDVKTCEFSINTIRRTILIYKPDLIFVYHDPDFNDLLYCNILDDAKDTKVLTVCDQGDAVATKYKGDTIEYILRPIKKKDVVDKINSMFSPKATENCDSVILKSEVVSSPEYDKALEMAKKNAEGEAESKKSGSATANFDLSKRNVIAIDDNPQILRNIMSILKPKYNVSVATNVLNAIQMLDSCDGDYDVMLLDYEMPGVDGPTGLTLFRQDPRMAGIPVVFLTGVSDKDRILKVVDLKPDAYLLKPIDADVLLKTVEDVINKKVGI